MEEIIGVEFQMERCIYAATRQVRQNLKKPIPTNKPKQPWYAYITGRILVKRATTRIVTAF
jgi:hypothetical protein